MNEVTPYPAIDTMLTEWAEGLKRLLGKKIVGLYVSGSLAYGDFVVERSDIDLQAVVRSPLTEDELRLVEQLHRQIEGRCPRWADRIECSYVPLELMAELSLLQHRDRGGDLALCMPRRQPGMNGSSIITFSPSMASRLRGLISTSWYHRLTSTPCDKPVPEICFKNGRRKLMTARGSRIANISRIWF